MLPRLSLLIRRGIFLPEKFFAKIVDTRITNRVSVVLRQQGRFLEGNKMLEDIIVAKANIRWAQMIHEGHTKSGCDSECYSRRANANQMLWKADKAYDDAFRDARNAFLDAQFEANGYVSVADSERFTADYFAKKVNA